MRIVLMLLCLAVPRAFGAMTFRQMFWDAHSRRFALVLVDTAHDVRLFVGTRQLLHQVEVVEPEWFEGGTEFRTKIGTGQTVTVRTMDTEAVMFMQEPATLALLYTEALVKERAGDLDAKAIPDYVRRRSFLESERWVRVEIDAERLRTEFQVIAHPTRAVDLDFVDACTQALVALNDN